jgi:3-oxoacyl-[acyl-carrier-protein] synthase III
MELGTKVSGIGMYIPSVKVDNKRVIEMLLAKSKGYMNKEEMEALIAEAQDKLHRVGSKIRYWCNEDEYCTDIAYKASMSALDDARIKAKDLDLIIFTGMSKAFVEPATAHILRNELNAVNANVIDTQDACTSFIKSIQIADALIKNGDCRKVLIASGERTFDWADFTCKTVDELAWKFASLTIGDAGGAIVLEATKEKKYIKDPKHFRFFYKLYSEAFSSCTIGLNYRVGERYRLFSHSKKLIMSGFKATSELIASIFATDEWKDFRYDVLIFHNVGNVVDGLIELILKESNAYISGKFKPFFSKYGNVGSASLPVSLCEERRNKRLKRGDMILNIVPAAGVQCGVMTFRY